MKSLCVRSGVVLFFSVLASVPSFSSGVLEKNGPRDLNFDQVLQKIVIETDVHEIHLSGGSGRGAQGKVVGEESDTVDARIVGDTLTIVVKAHRDFFSWGTRTSRVDLSIPSGLIVEVTSVSGSILVDVATSQLSAKSVSGNIVAKRGGGLVFATTTSGPIDLEHFTGPIKASSTSGPVTIQASQGEMELSNVSGPLRGESLEPRDPSRFSTVSGEIFLNVGPKGNYSVTGKTTSGTIRFWDVKGNSQLSTGTGPIRLRLSTTSGNLTVD